MADYVTISDTQVDPDAPITSQLAYAWRDNPTAIAEGASGAPRIQTASIENNAVTSSKIKNDAVTSSKIENNAVTSSKIKNDAVTSSKIKNDAVTSSKIEDNAVTSSKLGTSNSIRDWVLARTAAASAGAVGTYAFMLKTTIGDVTKGGTVSGSALKFAGLLRRTGDQSSVGVTTGDTASGTWRCMGDVESSGSGSTIYRTATVWLRIS
jgi:hypothetical protein